MRVRDWGERGACLKGGGGHEVVVFDQRGGTTCAATSLVKDTRACSWHQGMQLAASLHQHLIQLGAGMNPAPPQKQQAAPRPPVHTASGTHPPTHPPFHPQRKSGMHPASTPPPTLRRAWLSSSACSWQHPSTSTSSSWGLPSREVARRTPSMLSQERSSRRVRAGKPWG